VNAPVRIERGTSADEWVGWYFHEEGKKCAECQFCNSWTEAHGERMAECDALKSHDATMCPALPDQCPTSEG
jgi:hypothetical protein